MAEAEVRDQDAATLDSYRWTLLEASARLSTARLIIAVPSPGLDLTETELLRPLEAPDADPFGLCGTDHKGGPRAPRGRTR